MTDHANLVIRLKMDVTGPYWSQVNTDSSNGLFSSGIKPLPGEGLTQVYVYDVTWPQYVNETSVILLL